MLSSAMRTASEEAVSIMYMLRALGIPVVKPTKVFGDNLGIIRNALVQESTPKKKHAAISFH